MTRRHTRRRFVETGLKGSLVALGAGSLGGARVRHRVPGLRRPAGVHAPGAVHAGLPDRGQGQHRHRLLAPGPGKGCYPKRSVVDRWNQAHDVRNLFVVDGSSFVTSAAANPTPTIQALALRAADGIWERRGEWT